MCYHLWGKLGSYLTAGHQLKTGNEEHVSQQKLQDIQCNYLIWNWFRTLELITVHILEKVALDN